MYWCRFPCGKEGICVKTIVQCHFPVGCSDVTSFLPTTPLFPSPELPTKHTLRLLGVKRVFYGSTGTTHAVESSYGNVWPSQKAVVKAINLPGLIPTNMNLSFPFLHDSPPEITTTNHLDWHCAEDQQGPLACKLIVRPVLFRFSVVVTFFNHRH